MPKIALLLRGHIRRAFETNELLEILSAICDKYETDIYIHTWSVSEASHSYRPLYDEKKLILEEMVREYLKPLNSLIKSLEVESEDNIKLIGDVDSPLGLTNAPRIGWKKMWYGIHKCSKAIIDSGIKYEAVINTRLDLVYFYRYLVSHVPVFKELKLDNLFLINLIKTFFGGKSKFKLYSDKKCWGVDNFYISNPQNMHKLICRFHFKLEEMVTKDPSQEFLVFEAIKRMEDERL